MPLQRSRGNVVSACEGVYFPMANPSKHRVTCVATRTFLQSLARRTLSLDDFLGTFNTYRRDIEAVASALYDKKHVNTPATIVIGLKELEQFRPLESALPRTGSSAG